MRNIYFLVSFGFINSNIKIRMKTSFILLSALLMTGCAGRQVVADYDIVPLPQSVKISQEAPFVITGHTVISYPEGDTLLRRDAEFLSKYVKQATGYELAVRTGAVQKAVILAINPEMEGEEAYRLTVNSQCVRIEGATAKGVFYGVQALRKAIPAVVDGSAVALPSVEIADAPRFEYRGMHLDVCRHFFPIEFVKEYIDLLALHNMNTLHFHLSEDQGWRIEIKKYPKLTEVGAVRHRTVVGRIGSGQYDSITVQGYYTQEQLRDLVRYAADRYVNIIPEIDLPGHMLAALASYPELGCTGGPYEVCPDWGVFADVLCIGNEQTFEFLEDVLSEVIDIFPSKYIHIGGDEIPRDRWKECPKCQARIKAEGLKADNWFTAEDRLQSYCMARIERFLNGKGRNIIGWDEILDGDVAPNATVMSWRGSEGGIKAAQMGHKAIMVPHTYCYFDYYQSEDTSKEPLAIGGYIPVEKVYGLEPTAGLTQEQEKYVWGVQANLWTEYITTTDHIEYMVLPRMAALAEVQWTQPVRKDYEDFTRRVLKLMRLYERDGLNYAKHLCEDEPSDTIRTVVSSE